MWPAVSNGMGMVVCLPQHNRSKNRPDQVGGLIHVEVRTPPSSTSAKEAIHIEARTPLSSASEARMSVSDTPVSMTATWSRAPESLRANFQVIVNSTKDRSKEVDA